MTAEPFNEDSLIVSSAYEETMNNVVLPYLETRVRRETLHGADQAPLACAVYSAEAPAGTLVLVHGFTESAFKFSELIYSLLRNRFNVVTLDQRGHGHSWRKEGLSNVGDTHVEHFADYISDLKIVCDRLLAPLQKPWCLFGHSMGGAVSVLFLEQYPEFFSRAVLCAPMIAPDRSGVPYGIAASLCHAARAIGHGSRRVFFFKPYSGPENFETSCATDPARFAWYDGIRVSHPEYQNCAPTYTWTLESMRVTRKILAPGAPERIACPVRLYGAEEDHSVLSEPQKQFISRVPMGEYSLVPRSRHEIYRSEDAVLFPWWHEILRFLSLPAASIARKAEMK